MLTLRPTDPLTAMSSCVLLLPGMSLNRTAYPELGSTTICPDFNSRPPRFFESGRADMGDYVDALDGWLDTQAAWNSERRIVVAHSFGGMLALSWMLRHRLAGPGRIDGMVLIATTAGPMFEVLRPVVLRLGRYRMRTPVTNFLNTWSQPVVMRAAKALIAGGNTEEVDFKKVKPATDFRVGLAGWRNTDWRAMRCYRMAMEGFDIRKRLSELDLPTEVLHGSGDTLFPTGVGRDLAESLPNARFTLVPGAGHTLGLTHPQYVRDSVTRLRGLPFRHASPP